MLFFLSMLTSLTFMGCGEKVPETESVCDDGLDDDLDNAIDCEDSDCASSCDVDGDGVSTAEDCDDNDASIYPGATEFCDGVDNNCSGDESDAVDAQVWYADTDGDSYGDPESAIIESCTQPSGHVIDNTDCDDSNSDINPGATEVPDNGVDENCDPSDDTTTD